MTSRTANQRPEDQPARAAGGDRRKWIGLVAISIAVSLIIVDSTIVNVAIPYIVRDLKIDSVQVQWVQEIYTLVFAATLLIWGNLADRWGRRRVLLFGVALFAVSSLLAALAPSGELLIAARLVQGVGGAIILPTSLSLINATFQGRDRGIAFAIWGSTIGGMAAVGPLLGGWLTTDFSWRWAFGINIPLGIVIVIGVLLYVDESKSRQTGRVDALGAVYSAIACAALVYGLIEGRQEGWWQTTEGFSIGSWKWPLGISPIPIIFAIAVIAATLFVLHGRRRSKRGAATIIAFDLFGIPSFRNGNIAAMIVSLGEFGIIVSLPIWLQNVLGYTALQTGLVLLSLAIGSFVASGLSATVGQRLNRVTIVRIGLVAEIVGLAGAGTVVSPSTTWAALVPFLFVYGFGVGLATAQLTGVVLKDVPVEQSGEGSGTSSLARQIGSALGIAILGTILFTTASNQLTTSLTTAGVASSERQQLVSLVVNSAGGAIPELEKNPATQQAANWARTAFSDGTKYSAFAAAGFLTLGLLGTLSLGENSGRSRKPTGLPEGRDRSTADAE
jgi:EmrB/QacA subfamily drug resistance transporter